MTRYENLVCYVESIGAKVIEYDFGSNKKIGWCVKNRIYINSRMIEIEKYEVLSEELGHYKTTYGNITNLADIRNLKQEIRARDASIQEICSINNIITCIKNGARNRDEISDMLFVSDELFGEAIKYHSRKNPVVCKDNLLLYFDENRLIII